MKNPIKLFLLLPILLLISSCNTKNEVSDIKLRVGFLGAPSHPNVEWSEENILLMKKLGFNAMQMNIAWGYRPNNEPLNMEDVVALPEKYKLEIDRDSTLNKNVGDIKTFIHSPENISQRAQKLKERSALCKKHGMRTIFHFGAPYVQYPAEEPLSQCTQDPLTVERYVELIRLFDSEFPDVDDLFLYTYDQNAWQCSEFGPCDKCNGVPLDRRVAGFVNTLAQTWHSLNPDGKLWWEPWEISAGQTYKIIGMLDNSCVGLSLHSSITEVQIALPADRWFKNMLLLAETADIPVIGEVWLGSATEEVEPYLYLPTPLATLRAMRAIYQAGKLTGIKEYYGNIPNREDPNLRMASLFFANPAISDEEAMKQLTAPYGAIADSVALYWKYSSQAVEFYPWDISWNSREVGKSDPKHSMTGATLKGVIWETPSWQSNRRANFMRTKETETPHFWMLEDAQLRFEATADRIDEALAVAKTISGRVPEQFSYEFEKGINELAGFRQRVLSYAYHIRETNLSNIMRDNLANNLGIKTENIAELRATLVKDYENQGGSAKLEQAIQVLDTDIHAFLSTWFLEPSKDGKNGHGRVCIGCPEGGGDYDDQKDVWTVTSR